MSVVRDFKLILELFMLRGSVASHLQCNLESLSFEKPYLRQFHHFEFKLTFNPHK